MKLWRLQRVTGSKCWAGFTNAALGDFTIEFVVRARSPTRARRLAADSDWVGAEGKIAWLDPQHSTCEPLRAQGDEEVITFER